MLAYHCGLRLGEVFGLMWEDIDFEAKTLSVNRQVQMSNTSKQWTFTDPKYNSFRTIDIDDAIVNLLRRERAHQNKARLYYAEYYTQLCVSGYVPDQSDHLYNSGSLGTDGTPVHMIMARENGTFIQPRILQHVGRVIHGKAGKECPCISENWDFHSLRHTHATMLLDAGVPLPAIQYRLGHTHINMTEHYTNHVTDNMRDNIRKAISSL